MRNVLCLFLVFLVFPSSLFASFYKREIDLASSRRIKNNFSLTLPIIKSKTNAYLYKYYLGDKINLIKKEFSNEFYVGNGSGFWVKINSEELSKINRKYKYLLVLGEKPLKANFVRIIENYNYNDKYMSPIDLLIKNKKKVVKYKDYSSKKIHVHQIVEAKKIYNVNKKTNGNILVRFWMDHKNLYDSYHKVLLSFFYDDGVIEKKILIVNPEKIRKHNKWLSKRFLAPSSPYIIPINESKKLLRVSSDIEGYLEIYSISDKKMLKELSKYNRSKELINKRLISQSQAQNFLLNGNIKSYKLIKKHPRSRDILNNIKNSHLYSKQLLDLNALKKTISINDHVFTARNKSPFYKIYSKNYGNRYKTEYQKSLYQQTKDYKIEYMVKENDLSLEIRTIYKKDSENFGTIRVGRKLINFIITNPVSRYYDGRYFESGSDFSLSQSVNINLLDYGIINNISIASNKERLFSVKVKKIQNKLPQISEMINYSKNPFIDPILLKNQDDSNKKIIYEALSKKTNFNMSSLIIDEEFKRVFYNCLTLKYSQNLLYPCLLIFKMFKKHRLMKSMLQTHKNYLSKVEYKFFRLVLLSKLDVKTENKLKLFLIKNKKIQDLNILKKMFEFMNEKNEILSVGKNFESIKKDSEFKIQMAYIGKKKIIQFNPSHEYEIKVYAKNNSRIRNAYVELNGLKTKSKIPILFSKNPKYKNSKEEYYTNGVSFKVQGLKSIEIESNIDLFIRLYKIDQTYRTLSIDQKNKFRGFKRQKNIYLFGNKNKYSSLRSYSLNELIKIKESAPLLQERITKINYLSKDKSSISKLEEALNPCFNKDKFIEKLSVINLVSNELKDQCVKNFSWSLYDTFNSNNNLLIEPPDNIKNAIKNINNVKIKNFIMNEKYFISKPSSKSKIIKIKNQDITKKVFWSFSNSIADESCLKPVVSLVSSDFKKEVSSGIIISDTESLLVENTNTNNCYFLVQMYEADENGENVFLNSTSQLRYRVFKKDYKIKLPPFSILRVSRHKYSLNQKFYFVNNTEKPKVSIIKCFENCIDRHHLATDLSSTEVKKAYIFNSFSNEDEFKRYYGSKNLIFNKEVDFFDSQRLNSTGSHYVNYSHRSLQNEPVDLDDISSTDNTVSLYSYNFKKRFSGSKYFSFSGLYSDVNDSSIKNFELNEALSFTFKGLKRLFNNFKIFNRNIYSFDDGEYMSELNVSLTKTEMLTSNFDMGYRVKTFGRYYSTNNYLTGNLREYFSRYQINHSNGLNGEYFLNYYPFSSNFRLRFNISFKSNEFDQNKFIDYYSYSVEPALFYKGFDLSLKFGNVKYQGDANRTVDFDQNYVRFKLRADKFFKNKFGFIPNSSIVYYPDSKELNYNFGLSLFLTKSKPFDDFSPVDTRFLREKRARYEY